MNPIYDQTVHRLQTLEPFVIQKVGPDGVPVDWFEIRPVDLAAAVILNPGNLYADIQQVSIQIMEWSRFVAQCQRVWEIHERVLRVWKAKQVVKGKEEDPKAAITFLESKYRTLSTYEDLVRNVERAAEALNSAQGVLEAFKAKRDVIRSFVRRTADGNADILAG